MTMSAYTDSLNGHRGGMTSPGQMHHVQSVNIDAASICRTRYRLSPYPGIGVTRSSLSPCTPPTHESSTPRPCPLPPLHPTALDLNPFAFQGQMMAGITPCSGARPLSPSTILLTQAQPLVLMNGGHFDPASLAMPDGYPPIPLPPGYEHLYNFDLHNSGYRKNVTKETTGPLKAWLGEHRKNPYPTKAEKIMLAIITKMTLTQVSTWFANARRRLKKETSPSSSPDSEHRKGTHERRPSNDNHHSSPTSSPALRAELPDSSKCTELMDEEDDEEISVDDFDDDGNDDGDEDERQRAALRLKDRRVPVIYPNPFSAQTRESHSEQCCDKESPNSDTDDGDFRPHGHVSHVSPRDNNTSKDYLGVVNNDGLSKCSKMSDPGSSTDQIPKNSHSSKHELNNARENRSSIHGPNNNENSPTKPKIWSISNILDFSGSSSRDSGNT